MGNFRPEDESFTQYFEKQEPLIGFVGYEHNKHDHVSAFGLIKFTCMPPIVEVEPEEEIIPLNPIIVETEIENVKFLEGNNSESSGFILGAVAILCILVIIFGIGLCMQRRNHVKIIDA